MKLRGRPARGERWMNRYRRALENDWPLVGAAIRRWGLRRLAAGAAAGGEAAVEVLVEALSAGRFDADQEMRRQAVEAVAGAAKAGLPRAREALCDLVIERDDPWAARAALLEDCLPEDDGRKALFLLLTEQWDRLERVDPDHRLLRRGYWAAGGESARRRAMDRLRARGLLEAVRAILMDAAGVGQVVRSGQVRRLRELDEQEWELTVQVLSAQSRWAEMMRLAEVAPVRRSAALLRAMRGRPGAVADDPDFELLLGLAQAWEAGAEQDAPLLGRQAWAAKHDNWVWCAAFSADGRLVATGGADTLLRVWDAASGALIRAEKFGNSVSCAAFSPDGRHLLAGSWDHTLRLWRLPEGDCLWSVRHEGAVTSAAFSPDGRFCLSGSWDRTVRLWRLSDGDCYFTREHDDVVWTVAFSPDARLWASGGWDGSVRVWQVADGKLLWRRNHARSVGAVAFSPDGRFLASAAADRTVRLWRTDDGEELWCAEQKGDVLTVVFSPDGRFVASAARDDVVRMWRAEDGACTWAAGEGGEAWSLSFSPDGACLAAAGFDRHISVYAVADGRCLWQREGDQPVSSVLFSPSARSLVSVGWDHVLRYWRLLPWWDIPLAEMDDRDLRWIELCQAAPGLDEGRRAGLRLLTALVERRRRWEIDVEESVEFVPIGEFDIEIEEGGDA